jgi:L,D-transpeptidase ErfK/SrfK
MSSVGARRTGRRPPHGRGTSPRHPVPMSVWEVRTTVRNRPRSLFSRLARKGKAVLLLAWPLVSQGALFPLQPGEDVVGKLGVLSARYDDTLSDIARRYDLGYDQIAHLNPNVDPWLPGNGTKILLPTAFVLPDAPRSGVVLNVPEMRLYYYPRSKAGQVTQVLTYPVGIGREGWATPVGNTRIVAKVPNPSWTPPKSVRAEHAAEGDPLPEVVPPGPDNPLGQYALRLALPGVLIHGTNKPYGTGMRVSHGCIRLYPEDIEQLFQRVPVNTPVHIVDQPYKAGWKDGVLYLEAHAPFQEQVEKPQSDTDSLLQHVLAAAVRGRTQTVDWDRARQVAAEALGVPIPISAGTPPTPKVLAQPTLQIAQAAPKAMGEASTQWWVEAGEFRERETAERAASKLRQHLPPVPAWPALHEGAYRVAAGPFNDRSEADTAASRIRERLRIKTRLLFRKPRGPVVVPAAQSPGHAPLSTPAPSTALAR